MMANILILQERPAPDTALRRSLQIYHHLIVVGTAEDAFKVLQTRSVDLIISSVHLEHSDVFDFLKKVKQNANTSHIPFVCFCSSLSRVASLQHALVANVAEILGSEYLALGNFQRSADKFDLEALRGAIEGCLMRGRTIDRMDPANIAMDR